MHKNSNLFESPKEMVLHFFNKVWHAPHDLSAIDDLMTENYVIYTAGNAIEGRANFKAWVKKFQSLLLNAKTVSEDVFYNEAENKVVSRWTCTGNNNGIFGLPADGEFLSFTGIAIWEIENDRLARCWVERSAFELYQKIKAGSEGKQFV